MLLLTVSRIWGAASAATPPTPDLYRVSAVAVDMRAGDSVGPKRSGSLCLPAGSLVWRDVKPDEAELRDALAAGLRTGGVPIVDPENPFADTAAADRVVKARVRGIRLSACVPPSGLGRLMNHSHAVKGDGLIAVEWSAYARGRNEPVMHGRSCTAFDYQEREGSLVRMMLAGMTAVGQRTAGELQGRPVARDDSARCVHVWGDTPDSAPQSGNRMED